MAMQTLSDVTLLVAQYDVAGDANQCALALSAGEEDATTFGDAWRVREGLTRAGDLSLSGFWEGGAGAIDEAMFARLGAAQAPVLMAPAAAEGGVAYGFQALSTQYAPGGGHGELLKFTVEAASSGPVVRGSLMVNALTTAKTVSGNGTARQLGAVSAAQRLYAQLHVVALTGTAPTLDVDVESDDAAGMTTPTTRISFAQAMGAGAEWAAPVAGAITDDWWRVSWALGGTNPSARFAVSLGIQD